MTRDHDKRLLMRVWFQYLRKWPPSVGSAAHPCSPPCQAPAAGIWEGGGFHPHPLGTVGALGEGPAGFARPTQNCWRPVSVAGSQYGRTSGPLSEVEVENNRYVWQIYLYVFIEAITTTHLNTWHDKHLLLLITSHVRHSFVCKY